LADGALFSRLRDALASYDIFFCGTNDPRSPDTLFPEELASIREAILPRKIEFATGRWCARQALAARGIAPGPLLRKKNGAPQWPRGVCGSITHCRGAWCASVASSSRYRSIGIDIEERSRAISEGALSYFANDDEIGWLNKFPHDARPQNAVRLFSAKESVFKALNPLGDKRLSFVGFSVVMSSSNGEFSWKINSPAADGSADGTGSRGFMFENGELFVTVATVDQ
jgi:4'-phosphopantetheinyl transferase EntD